MLHYPTILIIATIARVVSTTFIYLRYREEPENRALRLFAITFALDLLGNTLFLTRGVAPGWVSINLANFVVGATFLLFLFSLLEFFQIRAVKWPWVGLLFVKFLLFVWFTQVDYHTGARVIIIAGYATATMLAAIGYLRGKMGTLSRAVKIILLVQIGAIAGVFLSRAVFSFLYYDQMENIVTDLPLIAFTRLLISVFGFSIALTTLLLLEAKSRVTAEDTASRLGEVLNERDRVYMLIGHELQSPLAKTVISLDHYRDDPGRLSEIIESETKNLQAVLDELLAWAKSRMRGEREAAEVNLEAETRSVVFLYREKMSRQGLRVKLTLPASPVVKMANPALYSICARALLGNALRYAAPKTDIYIGVERTDADVRLTIQNKIAQKPPEPGHRIGLSLLASEVRQAGGDLSTNSSREEFFARVSLPL